MSYFPIFPESKVTDIFLIHKLFVIARLDVLDDSGGDTSGYHVGRDIFCHHTGITHFSYILTKIADSHYSKKY